MINDEKAIIYMDKIMKEIEKLGITGNEYIKTYKVNIDEYKEAVKQIEEEDGLEEELLIKLGAEKVMKFIDKNEDEVDCIIDIDKFVEYKDSFEFWYKRRKIRNN